VNLIATPNGNIRNKFNCIGELLIVFWYNGKYRGKSSWPRRDYTL